MYSFISRLNSIIDLCVYLHANTHGSSAGKRMHLQHRRPWFGSWVRKICWRRDRLPTPVFLGFPAGSPGKEPACSVGDLGSISWLGRPLEKRWLPTSVFWPGELNGLYSPWDCKELDMTKSLSLRYV